MNKNIYLVVSAIALIVIAAVWLGNRPEEPMPSLNANPDNLSGIQKGDAPWPPELNHLRERLTAIGLPVLSEEGTALHIHQHLDVFIDGKQVPVPSGIGINEAAGFISPIHTHDATAIVHIESPTLRKFTLGQFFDVWGVRFTNQCVGGYCGKGDKTLKVFVNGNLVSGDPRQVELAERQEIVVAYGADKDLPNPVPPSFSFPANL